MKRKYLIDNMELLLNRIFLRLKLAKWRDELYNENNRLKAISIQKIIDKHIQKFG